MPVRIAAVTLLPHQAQRQHVQRLREADARDDRQFLEERHAVAALLHARELGGVAAIGQAAP